MPFQTRCPTIEDHVDRCYPVGSIFLSVLPTNPAEQLGIGTWIAFAAGRALVGLDASDADFNAAEKTSGAKTATLTEAQLPAHTHLQDAHNHLQAAHTHVVTSQTATTGGATSYEHGVLDTSSTEAEATEVTGATTAVNQAATAVNQDAGGGQAHNNIQPSIAIFMFKRIS
jgi:microcystin-dependent protein